MTAYPLCFHPLLKPKVWGGRRLERFGKALPAGEMIGESWELADLPLTIDEGRSVIANGPLAGLTLREALQREGRAIMGSASLAPDGGFPLLIKFLDANEHLSVQVHPDAAYVARHPETHLKSEAWIVMEAEPGAVIYKGIKPGVTRKAFTRHVEDGSVADDLIAIPARRGDCHYLPSGTVHALGAGLLVAEIQTPSDTTFRVFDWGRTGRTLHVEQALQCIHFDAHTGQRASPAKPMQMNGLSCTVLVTTEFFSIERLEAIAKTSLDIVPSNQPMVWMVLQGSADIHSPFAPDDERHVPLRAGSTVLVPAALREATIEFAPETVALRITLPSPTQGVLA